jgi:hypothetical protein
MGKITTVVNYSGIFITLAPGVASHLKSLSMLACFPLEIYQKCLLGKTTDI